MKKAMPLKAICNWQAQHGDFALQTSSRSGPGQSATGHQNLISKPRSRVIKPKNIISAVIATFGISEMDLLGKKRSRTIVKPRHICMWLIRKHTSLSFPDIGKIFSNRDHANVQYACNKINNGLKSDPDLKTTIALVERNLQL